ncbi:putative nuclease HARBI1, partial [Nematostella vectensis]|uniref:putative nuclease HARBI1 n=1 Tax=Nematostella vectensis TaxID=45351 RepID=UPI0020775B8B
LLEQSTGPITVQSVAATISLPGGDVSFDLRSETQDADYNKSKVAHFFTQERLEPTWNHQLHQGLFTNIVARWPGSTHDAFIFRNSSIQNTLEREHTRIDEGYLLGDSGYPCRPFLMKPYPNPANQHQEDFNEAHSKTSVKIEQCFGLFKRRFHLMHGEVRMKPEKVSQLIGACAVLHNIAILRNDIYDGPAAGPDDEPDLNVYQGPEDGKIIRDFISNSYF